MVTKNGSTSSFRTCSMPIPKQLTKGITEPEACSNTPSEEKKLIQWNI